MKKIQISLPSFVLTSSLLASALLVQACGSSTNNANPVTAQAASTCETTNTCGTTPTTGGTAYSSCASYGGSMTTVSYGGSNVSVCRYYVSQTQVFDIEASEMTITSSGGLHASGGYVTNLQLSQGDKLEVISVGHYSPQNGVCDTNNGGGDISVLGNSNGKDMTTNPNNGQSVGLWYAFENASNQYSTPVLATTQYGSSNSYQGINVPMGSATNYLVIGYNWDGSIGCGDMGAYYTILRCVDANGNTYTCN